MNGNSNNSCKFWWLLEVFGNRAQTSYSHSIPSYQLYPCHVVSRYGELLVRSHICFMPCVSVGVTLLNLAKIFLSENWNPSATIKCCFVMMWTGPWHIPC